MNSKNNINPKISVIMPTYNRCEFLKESLKSILEQTYKDFELIIVDDCSTDGTKEYIEKTCKKDLRIKYIRNQTHQHYNYGLRLGCKIAKGEYIARMDDDDISLSTRFAKQVKFLDENPDITVVGTFFELFGDNSYIQNWVNNSKPEYLALDTFHRCPLCHPTVMMRKSFLLEKNIGYQADALYAEDSMLWTDIILAGGKLANIPEVLLKYRVGHAQVSTADDTSLIQRRTANKAKAKMWQQFFSKKETSYIVENISSMPSKDNPVLWNALYKIAQKNSSKYPEELIYEYMSSLGIRSENMHICLAGNNQIVVPMAVAITSIVKNMRIFDTIDLFILENDISAKNKKKIKKLEKNNVSIEFIRVDVKMFEKRCPKGQGCVHVPVQTYFRYLIPQLKPEYDKVLYLDCDMVVCNSLIELWNIDLGDNYAAAVQEFYFDVVNRMQLKVPTVFNAGMLLLNNKKLVKENISEKLFENTDKFKDKIVYVDQDILNYTFDNKIVWVAPKYNATIDLWRPGTCGKTIYSEEELWIGKNQPVIIHYNGPCKPWKEDGYKELKKYHPFAKKYFKVLKSSPFKVRYWKNKAKKLFYSRTETIDYVKTQFLFLKFKKRKPLNPSMFFDKINYICNMQAKEKKLIEQFENQIETIRNQIETLTEMIDVSNQKK